MKKIISRGLESLTGVWKAGTVPRTNVVVLLSEYIKRTIFYIDNT